MRERLRDLVSRRRDGADRIEGLHALRESVNAEVRAWARRENARRKRRGEAPLPIRFEADQITDLALRARVEAAIAEVSAWEAERARLREEIRDVARGLSPQPGDKELVLVCVYAGEFNTQGFGADRYAEAHAEARADVARLHGIAVEVVRACQLFDGASEAYRAYQARQPLSLGGQVLPVEHAQAWHVVVRVVEDLDVEILKHHPGPDLVESVRLSWARGVNPRVANPWLPHDFEARHGLDHFGGRVTPAT